MFPSCKERGASAFRGELMPHQEEAIDFMLRREVLYAGGGINGDDMGLGKTVVTSFLLAARPLRTLIVVPHTLATQWRQELDKFVGVKAEVVLLRDGELRNQHTGRAVRESGGWLEGVSATCHTVITTYSVFQQPPNVDMMDKLDASILETRAAMRQCRPGSRLQRLSRALEGLVEAREVEQGWLDRTSVLQRVAWGRLVMDEAQHAKNPDSLLWHGLDDLSARHKWCLTGTVCHNRCRDYATLLTLVGSPSTRHLVRKLEFSMHDKRCLKQAAEHLFIRRTKQAVLGDVLVGVNYHTQRGDFCESEGLFYRLLQTTLDQVKHNVRLQRLLHLRQCCVSPLLCLKSLRKSDLRDMVDADALMHLESIVTDTGSTSKMRLVADVMRNLNLQGEPHTADKAIIYAQWEEEALLVAAELSRMGIQFVRLSGNMRQRERDAALRSFEGHCHVLLAQINVAGVGLNLQHANTIVFVVPDYNSSQEMQAICRAYRTGQKRVVTVYRCCLRDSVEENIVTKQLRKALNTCFVLDDDQFVRHMNMHLEPHILKDLEGGEHDHEDILTALLNLPSD